MTDNEIWDAKWLAFKLAVISRNDWCNTYDDGRTDRFDGEDLIEILENPPKNQTSDPKYRYVGGMGTHSAMAKAFRFLGIKLEDAPKLRAAAKRERECGKQCSSSLSTPSRR